MQESGKTLDPDFTPPREFWGRGIFLKQSETLRLLKERITTVIGILIIAVIIFISIFAPFLAIQHPTADGGWPIDMILRYNAEPSWSFLAAVMGVVVMVIILIIATNRYGIRPTEQMPRLIVGVSVGLLLLAAGLVIILMAQARINETYLLGSDFLGRDILSRLMYGSRVSMKVSLIAVGLALFLGIPMGVLAAYYGGKVDLIISRVVDLIFSFPGLILAILILAALGNGINQAMVAIGIATTPNFARLIRSSALAIKEQEYMQAAKAAGAGDIDIIIHHMLPNSLSPIIVQATLSLAGAIIAEASLSFLGLGVQPPTPTWGYMMNYGLRYIAVSPWMSIFSGLAITITVLGFNLFGDGLRDAVDPRLKRER